MKTVTLIAILTLLVMNPVSLKSQMVCVAGKIIDKITGETIRQLSVVENNTGIGTISSENGVYSLLLKPGKVLLTFFDEKHEKFSASFELKSDTILNVYLNLLSLEAGKKGRKELRKAETNSEVAENPKSEIK